MDVEELIRLLNRAYASEWLAYHQYWLGAKLIKGPMKDAVAAELTLHATEELSHAVLVADRILQLGGTPVTNPKDWPALSPCAYDAPDDPYVGVLLDQNIAGEQCAISVYKELVDLTREKDRSRPTSRSPSSSRSRARGGPPEPEGGSRPHAVAREALRASGAAVVSLPLSHRAAGERAG